MKKFFKWLIVILIALQAIIIVAGVVIFRMPLPDHEVDVSGLPLTDFVEILEMNEVYLIYMAQMLGIYYLRRAMCTLKIDFGSLSFGVI